MPRPCLPPPGRSDLNSIAEAARHVLLTAEPAQKVMASRAAARAWKQGRLDFSFDVAMPRFPARPERPQLLPPGRMPKRGRAGSDRSRIALLHALAHIEFVAIDPIGRAPVCTPVPNAHLDCRL